MTLSDGPGFQIGPSACIEILTTDEAAADIYKSPGTAGDGGIITSYGDSTINSRAAEDTRRPNKAHQVVPKMACDIVKIDGDAAFMGRI